MTRRERSEPSPRYFVATLAFVVVAAGLAVGRLEVAALLVAIIGIATLVRIAEALEQLGVPRVMRLPRSWAPAPPKVEPPPSLFEASDALKAGAGGRLGIRIVKAPEDDAKPAKPGRLN